MVLLAHFEVHFDLFLKVTEVKVQNGTVCWHISLLFDLEHSNLGHPRPRVTVAHQSDWALHPWN
jgi:hypothetical protein